jgi:GT2 family glycosyltransferase
MKKNNVKLGIVFLQHNRSDYTERTLQSIYETAPKSTYVLVGDCESDIYDIKDTTRKISILSAVERLDRSFNLKIIHENESIGKNKNILIREVISNCNPDHLLICDNDMSFTEGWYEKAVELMKKSNADLLGLWRHPHHHSVRLVCDGVDEMNNIPGNCWFTTPDIFKKAGNEYLKEFSIEDSLTKMGEDTEFIFRMHNLRLKAYSVTENLMHHFGEIRSDGKKAIDFA